MPDQWIEDVVQEVAARALAARPRLRFDSERDFWKWSWKVAHRLVNDMEKRKPTPLLQAISDSGGYDEIEDRLAAKQLLSLVSAEDRREAFMVELPAPDGVPASTWRVRRHRVRQRVAAAVDGFLGAALVPATRLRRHVETFAPALGAAIGAASIPFSLAPPTTTTAVAMSTPAPASSASAFVSEPVRPSVVSQAAHKPASIERLRSTGPSPSAAAPFGTVAQVSMQDRVVVEVGHGETPPRAPLACVGNVPVVGTACVAHPRR